MAAVQRYGAPCGHGLIAPGMRHGRGIFRVDHDPCAAARGAVADGQIRHVSAGNIHLKGGHHAAVIRQGSLTPLGRRQNPFIRKKARAAGICGSGRIQLYRAPHLRRPVAPGMRNGRALERPLQLGELERNTAVYQDREGVAAGGLTIGRNRHERQRTGGYCNARVDARQGG